MLVNPFDDGGAWPSPQNLILKWIDWISYLYFWTIFFWGIPYLILAIGLFFWSKDKSVNSLLRLALKSPLFLAIPITFESFILLMAFSLSLHEFVISISLFVLFVTIVMGYIFVMFGALVYKLFEYFRLIKK